MAEYNPWTDGEEEFEIRCDEEGVISIYADESGKYLFIRNHFVAMQLAYALLAMSHGQGPQAMEVKGITRRRL